jgi:hypothetical protein
LLALLGNALAGPVPGTLQRAVDRRDGLSRSSAASRAEKSRASRRSSTALARRQVLES